MSDGPFDDAGELRAEVSDEERAITLASLIRADVAGVAPGAVARAFDAALRDDGPQLAFAWNDAMERDGLGDWIAEDPSRVARARELALHLAPPDPSAHENAAALREMRAFGAWGRHEYALIVVPGYTPRDRRAPAPGVHDVARRRLERAAADYHAGLAPFVLLSGGAVYPRGTPYAEAIEMKEALLAMGVPEARVLCDARARHSTTNLRNAGRLMLAEGLPRAVITTLGGGLFGSDLFGQDFYFGHPVLSTFQGRCEKELGYRVGELEAVGEAHIAFVPSPDVRQIGFRDALDP